MSLRSSVRAHAVQFLGNESRSSEAWKKAISALPTENPSAADLKQREQYEAELKAIETKIRELNTGPPPSQDLVPSNVPANETPWIRAVALKREIATREDAGEPLKSSVSV